MRKLLIVLFLFIGLLANATTYHVAKTGNDGNSGTLASPFLTINRATYNGGSPALNTGDSLLVHVGTYNESVMCYGYNGVLGDPIVIKNYSTDVVVIDGTGLTPVNPYNVALLRVYLADYITVIGFTITGIAGTNAGIYLQGNYNTVSNCIIHDVYESGVIGLGNYNIIEYCTIYNVCMSNSDGIFTPGEYWGAGTDTKGDYSIQRHNTIYDSWGEGLSCTQADYATIEDNIVYDNFSVNLYLMNSINCIVQRNLVYMTKFKGEAGQKGNISSTGIGHWNEDWVIGHVGSNNTFINNIIYNCERNLYTYAPLINILIANNTFVNSTYIASAQINYDAGHSNTIIANNIIIQDDVLPCISINTASGGITYNNNLYNKAYDADAVGVGDVTSVAHFVDSVAHDYHLKSGSPAINAGLTALGVNTDFANSLRDASPDIGAYEYDPPVSPPSVLPSVITLGATYNVRNGIGTGNITSDGGGTITAGGVCWNTSTNPTISNSKTTGATAEGAFSANISGLKKSTTYYLKAYATNASGTSYGQEISFTTPASSTGVNSTGKVSVDGSGKVLIIE